MLDRSARRLIESARLPVQLTGEYARDLVSRSYLHWLATDALGAEVDIDDRTYIARLSRLSLASSLLHIPEDRDSASTAFLVAESADVARVLVAARWQDLPAAARFRRAVHYLDLASFFHLADYDANAGVVASEALDLLNSITPGQLNVTTTAHLSYYRSLAFFLLGQFGNCKNEADRHVEAQTAEERAFLFLRTCLASLTDVYMGQDSLPPEVEKRLSRLSETLQTQDHSYFTLFAEVTRLLQFRSAVERKSLYRKLVSVLAQEQGYLMARISSHDNQGYPFAWPSSRSFCEEYLSGRALHAVVTLPTGAGKGFLAELAVAQALRRGWVLYLAPTNALCAQVRDDLRESLRTITDFGIEAFLGKSEYTTELPRFQMPRQVLAITPEKALLLLKREPDRFKECSLVVVDECQLLGSGNRGDIAEIVLAFAMAQNPEVRVILMSALVSDRGKLAEWLQRTTGRPAANISLPWRPTRVARVTVLPDWDTLTIVETRRGKKRRNVGVRAYADTVTPWEEQTPLVHWPVSIRIEETSQGFPWRNEVSRRLAELMTSRDIPTLLFVLHNRHHAFSIANDFEVEIPNRPEASQRENDLYDLAGYELGANSLVERLTDQKGVAVHTAIMLDCEREASEIAFARGRVRLLAATGTLSQGLNLVAKAVIICGTHLSEYGEEGNVDPEELERLSLNQVLNAMGRAARAQIACRGVSIVVPDNLIRAEENLNPEASKSRFISRLEVLGREEASLPIDSSLKQLLGDVGKETRDADIKEHERLLLSRLPVDSDSLGLTVRNLLGMHELQEDDAAEKVIGRLEAVKAQAMRAGCKEWVLGAASLAGIEFQLARSLQEYIESQSNETGFDPPEDSYTEWAVFLIGWLRTLPARATWEILQMHTKGWRYYWGKEKDPDLLEALQSEGYPETVSEESLNLLRPIWRNMQVSVCAWLEGKSIVEIGEVLTRRQFSPEDRLKRTNAGHCVPRVIIWSRGFIDRLSRFAGLLLALYDQWKEHEPDSMPDWFAEAMALYTLPQGIRFGVKDPFALAWHRYVIQERRTANLLQSLVPLDTDSITDLQEARQYVNKARRAFLSTRFADEEPSIISVLKRLVATG